MFLLRRKSDGKFYKNPDYHARNRALFGDGTREALWTEDASKCKPFLSEGGAKNSRGVTGMMPEHLHDTSNGWAERGKWYGRANKKVRAAWEAEKFKELYEIVPISINVL